MSDRKIQGFIWVTGNFRGRSLREEFLIPLYNIAFIGCFRKAAPNIVLVNNDIIKVGITKDQLLDLIAEAQGEQGIPGHNYDFSKFPGSTLTTGCGIIHDKQEDE